MILINEAGGSAMKRRKYMAVVMAGLFALAMPITGYAEEKSNVWIEEAESEGQVLATCIDALKQDYWSPCWKPAVG